MFQGCQQQQKKEKERKKEEEERKKKEENELAASLTERSHQNANRIEASPEVRRETAWEPGTHEDLESMAQNGENGQESHSQKALRVDLESKD